MTHLDADLVDGVAMRSSAGREGVTQAVEGLTLDAETTQDTPEVRTVRGSLVGVGGEYGLKGKHPLAGAAIDGAHLTQSRLLF